MGDHWDLTKDSSKTVKAYLDYLESSELWQAFYGERAKLFGVSPHFYLDFFAWSNPDENLTYIVLDYKTGWQPGHYTTITWE